MAALPQLPTSGLPDGWSASAWEAALELRDRVTAAMLADGRAELVGGRVTVRALTAAEVDSGRYPLAGLPRGDACGR